jgi:hypothetical protein
MHVEVAFMLSILTFTALILVKRPGRASVYRLSAPKLAAKSLPPKIFGIQLLLQTR